jgi:hypothetical protein
MNMGRGGWDDRHMANGVADYLAELRDWDADGFDEHWELVDRFVADVGTEQALAAAQQWCDCEDAATYSAGLDVLGTLARREADVVGELVDRSRSARDSDDEDLRWSAAVALQQIEDVQARDLLVLFLDDPDSDVRCQAVYGLSTPMDPDLAEEHPVVKGLLRAMRDPDENVRDWATFTIGTQRVYPVLADELADPDIGNLYVEAAAELGDPRLLPMLDALKAAGWQEYDPIPSTLDDAIAACSGD